MRRSFLLLFMTLPALITAGSAQTASSPAGLQHSAVQPAAATAQFQDSGENAQGCPVGFTVARQSATELLAAKEPARRDAQGIKVSLEPASSQQIRSAEILVHANIGGPGLLPLGYAADVSQIDRTFHLEHKGAGPLERSLVLARVNGVTSADLITLRFADGSTWHADKADPCRAVPSLFLPVTGSR